MTQVLKVKRNYIDYLYFIVFGILVILFITGQFSNVTGMTLVVIDNEDPNSMFPTYFQGDLFLLYHSKPDNIHLGDVVVYEKGQDRIIHRVVDIVQDGQDWYFRVKGDDPITNFPMDRYGTGGDTLIPYSAILGKVFFRMPYVGHISLAMQQNAAVKFLVYTIVILITIAIFFWPESEEEDEEESYIEIGFTQFKNQIRMMKEKTTSNISLINKSGHRPLVMGIGALMILLLVTPMFIAPVLPQTYNNKDLGVDGISEISNGIVQNESRVASATVIYYYLSVHLHDNTVNFRKIKGFTLSVYVDPNDASTKVSEMVWHTRRTMKGTFMVGSAILIPLATAQQFTGIVNMTIVVKLDVRNFGFKVSSDPFMLPFSFDSAKANITTF